MDQIALNWELTSKINHIAGKSLPWLAKLEEITVTLLMTYECDGVWILTLPPLRLAAAGVLRTSLQVDPPALIILSDAAPPVSRDWPPESSILGHTLRTGEAQYGPQHLSQNRGLDQDLGDVLFQFSEVDIQAIVPIRTDQQTQGMLVVANRDGRSFSQNAFNMLRYLGQHLALVLHNASLVEIAQHQARQLSILNRIARTITSSLNMDEVIALTMAGIDEILDVEAGALLLLDELRQELIFKILLRGAESIATTHRLNLNEGIAGWVFQNQQPALVHDVSTDPRFSNRIDQATGFATRSVLCTPLVVNGRSIGVLEVLNKRSGPFTLADQELLTSMTASLAVALQNSQLFGQVRKQVWHMEQINSLTADINATISFSETIRSIVSELAKLFHFDQAMLGLLDESRVTIQHTLLDTDGRIINHMPPVPLRDSFIRHVLAAEVAYKQFDLSKPPAFAEGEWLRQQGIGSILVILLKSDNSEFGVFALTAKEKAPIEPDDLKRLVQIAPTLSNALEKARLMDAMVRRTVELEELNLLGERLLTDTDPEFILDTALGYIPRLLPAAVHGLILIDPETTILGLRLPENASKGLVDHIQAEMIESLQNSLQDRQEIEIDQIYHIFNNSPVADTWRPRSKLCWPILTLRGSLGVVYLAYQEELAISPDRMRLFSLVVSRLAGTMENSRLFTEVEQERARLAAILSSTADGILVVDRASRVLLDNPAANQILEHPDSQRNKYLVDITDNEALLTLFEQAEKSGSAAGEFTTLEDKTYYTSVSPVAAKTNLDKKTVIGWVAVMQDITHVLELNDAKDNFVNAVSHDLRAPLSGISLASQLIEMSGEVNERQAQFLRTIQDHIAAMTSLIDALLDVGKIEADIDMQMTPQMVVPLIQEAIESLKDQAAQKQQTLELNLIDGTVQVHCNTVRLQQVFTNLISNAIKYTPEGGLIKVNLMLQEDYLLFQVIDNGIGIPQADQPHIFEKFYRVRGEHMTGIKGSGLGLAITKSIIEKHRGTIWVDSKFKGGGSTFSVLLPITNDGDAVAQS